MKKSTVRLVKVGSFSVPITRFADGRFCASISGLESGRRRVTGRDIEEVTAEVERLLVQVVNGQTEAADLTATDARIFVAARKAIFPYSLEVDQAARILAEAAAILGDASKVVEAARHYRASNPLLRDDVTIDAAVEHFLREKETEVSNGDLGEEHVGNLRDTLEKFAEAFTGRPIRSLKTPEMQDWLNSRNKRDGKPVGKRRRRHLRDRVCALFFFARDQAEYLPRELKTEAEKLKRPKVVRGTQPTFSPDAFALLLNNAPERLVPALAIGGFAGMRPSEIARLDWSAIDLEKGYIDVSAIVAGKTSEARIIELRPHQENLLAWLLPHRKASGPVLDPKITRIDNLLRRTSQRIGIKWKQNVLRGSCASYLFAQTSDLGYVARQLGNSAGTLKKEYIERKNSEQAKAWFAIKPPGAEDNIIPLPLQWSVA